MLARALAELATAEHAGVVLAVTVRYALEGIEGDEPRARQARRLDRGTGDAHRDAVVDAEFQVVAERFRRATRQRASDMTVERRPDSAGRTSCSFFFHNGLIRQ